MKRKRNIERMCNLDGSPSLSVRQLTPGLEFATADNLRDAFRPHKHDRYVVGITHHGIQSFRYRGAQRRACAGEAFAIHPDETHDGQPGSDVGYSYRAVYVAPELVSDALGTQNAPFVREAISRDADFLAALLGLFHLSTFPLGDVALSDCFARLVDAMNRLSDSPTQQGAAVDVQLADCIRTDLLENAFSGRSMKELEQEHGLNRFAITRLFRKRFGVSPQQFIIHRRIAKARDLIAEGLAIADAANASGFADQSHMTRHFIKTIGTTPRAWRKLALT